MQRYREIIKYSVIRSSLLINFCNFLTGGPSCQQINGKLSSDINVHKWIEQHFAKSRIPPFSFVYGGKDSKTFITRWRYYAEKLVNDDPNVEKYLYSYRDRKSGLEVKCFVNGYTDFHAVEWVLKFSNTSTRNTPILEKTDAVNYSFAYDRKGTFTLHHAKGSNAERSDFMPLDDTLEIGKILL